MKQLGTKEYVAVAVGIAVIASVFLSGGGFSLFSVGAPAGNEADSIVTPGMPQNTEPGQNVSITDVTIGTGAEAKVGSAVEVQYELTLADGTKVDSSYDRGNVPLPFTIGAQNIIPGFSVGTLGMKVGGKRTVIVPPALGYGATGIGPIPPNATLTFTIELVSVK